MYVCSSRLVQTEVSEAEMKTEQFRSANRFKFWQFGRSKSENRFSRRQTDRPAGDFQTLRSSQQSVSYAAVPFRLRRQSGSGLQQSENVPVTLEELMFCA